MTTTGAVRGAPFAIEGAVIDRSSVEAGAPLTPGLQLGDYRIERQLGRGATSTVHSAYDLVRHRTVALKTLAASDLVAHGSLFQLKREFRIASNLNHPNIVSLHELVLDERVPFFAMELIEGLSLADFLRGVPDRVAATRALLPALTSAVERAHAAGITHGDLKPQNVLVEAGGRPVVLDFGFARTSGAQVGALDAYGLTPAYAAPERLRGAPATPSTDWYSVGALIFEALSGAPPYAGTPAELYAQKARGAPPLPHREGGWPEDLQKLVTSLLDPRPSARLLERPPPIASVPRDSAAVPALRDAALALAPWRSGDCVRLWAWGESQSGKTAFLRALADEIRTSVPDAWILHAACWNDEVVPRNAFDGVVDQLASMLMTLPVATLRDIVASTAPLVAAMFPIFEAVAQRAEVGPAESPDLTQCVAALRQTLVEVSRRRPLCLLVDDAHRGDADSGKLFLDLFASGPVPPLLYVAAMSSEARESSEMWATIERSGGLHWLRGRDVRVELHRSAEGVVSEEHAPVLEEPSVAEVLGILTVARRPLLQRTLSRALRAPWALDAFLEARRARVLDFQRLHPDSLMAIGGAGVPVLDPQSRRELHQRLAEALADDPRESSAVAWHWREAGEAERAATHALTAARNAERAMASASASKLFSLALEWGGWSDTERTEIRRSLAASLCLSGRTAEAAAIEADLARTSGDQALLRRAAEHYLAAGFHREGMTLLEPMLSAAGLPLGRGTGASLLGTLGNLTLLRFGSSAPAPEDAAAAPVIDLCWSATRGLIATDFVRGAYFATHGLRRALAGGDVRRSARAMAVVGATVLGPIGGRFGAWGDEWLARAIALASPTNDPHLFGTIAVLRGQLHLVRGESTMAFEESVRGQRLLRAQAAEANFERNVGRMGALRAAEDLGQYDYLRSRAHRYLREARDAGDRYATLTFAFSASFAALLADDVAAAERVLHEARRQWSVDGFHIQHLYIARSNATTALYRGDPAAALAIVDAMWPDLERAQFLRVPVALIDATWVRARARLACLETGELSDATGLERDIASLRAVGRANADAFAALLHGGLAAHRGDRALATEALQTAALAFTKLGMTPLALLARARFAEVSADPQARDSATEALASLGVARTDRWLAAFAPGSDRHAS